MKNEISLHDVYLVEMYEKDIELLNKRIEDLEAIRLYSDGNLAIAKRYASHYLGKTFDESWTQGQLEEYFVRLIQGAIAEALEHAKL